MSSLREKLFRYRGLTPVPFLIVMLVFADPVGRTMLVGGLLLIAGELLRLWGVAHAGSLTRVTGSVGAPEVVMTGPFAHVRNPLYLGNVVMYTGIGIMANALAPWLVLAAMVFFSAQYRLIVSLEEEFLQREFGAAYLEYKKNVPRFLPRLVPYRSPSQEHRRPRWGEALRSERRTFQALVLVVAALLFYLQRT